MRSYFHIYINMIEMDIKYHIENNYMKCVLQISGISGPRPLVRSNCLVGSGRVRGARHIV